MVEGQDLERTVLLGVEPVCWSAVFGHTISQGCEWALLSSALLSVQASPFPSLLMVVPGSGTCFGVGFPRFPL